MAMRRDQAAEKTGATHPPETNRPLHPPARRRCRGRLVDAPDAQACHADFGIRSPDRDRSDPDFRINRRPICDQRPQPLSREYACVNRRADWKSRGGAPVWVQVPPSVRTRCVPSPSCTSPGRSSTWALAPVRCTGLAQLQTDVIGVVTGMPGGAPAPAFVASARAPVSPRISHLPPLSFNFSRTSSRLKLAAF
jgi:hypothetical protein